MNKCETYHFFLERVDEQPIYVTVEWDFDKLFGTLQIGLASHKEPQPDDGGSIYFDEDGNPTLVWEMIDVEPRFNGLGTAILHLVARTSPFDHLHLEAELAEEADQEIRGARDALWRRCTMSPTGDTVSTSDSGAGRVEGRLVDPYKNGSNAKQWAIRQIHVG